MDIRLGPADVQIVKGLSQAAMLPERQKVEKDEHGHQHKHAVGVLPHQVGGATQEIWAPEHNLPGVILFEGTKPDLAFLNGKLECPFTVASY